MAGIRLLAVRIRGLRALAQDRFSVKRQEDFDAWMRARGYSPAAMMRALNIGKAALNRAYKRGELAIAPHILTVSVAGTRPMGRPLDVPELPFRTCTRLCCGR
jgi:hypothetical protein